MSRAIFALLLLSAVGAWGIGCAAVFADEPAAWPVPPNHTLTLADLEQLAWRHHPELVAATERYRAARALQTSAGSHPNPFLAYDAGGIGSDGTAGAQGFFLEQEFIRAEKRHWTQALAQHEADQRHWQITAAASKVLSDVRRRYSAILTLQQHLEVDHQAVAMAEEIEQLTRAMQETDEAHEADRLLVQGLVRRRHLDLRNRHSRLQAAWQELAAAVGLPNVPTHAPLGSRGLAHRVAEDRWLPARDEQLFYSHLIANSADVQVAQSQVLKAQAAVASQRAEAMPNATVRAGAQYDFASEQPQGSLRVTIPLGGYSRNHGRLRAAEAELRQAGAEVERVILELRQRGALLLDSYRTNSAVAEEYRLNVLPGAQRVYQIYLQRFADERSSYSDAESAMENYVSRLREYVDALGGLRKAEAQLSLLLGHSPEVLCW